MSSVGCRPASRAIWSSFACTSGVKCTSMSSAPSLRIPRYQLYLHQTQPMSRVQRRFLYIGLAIATTLLVGTVGFMVVAGYPAFDAFYMTLITMTTVGYAEIHPLTQAGRIFNSFLIAFGVSTIFIAVGAMTQTIVEMEFGDAIGKRRNKRMIEKMKDHYIVCGYGRVGQGAAAELQRAG